MFLISLSTYICWSLSPDLTSLVIVFGSSLRNTAHHFNKFVYINLSVSVFIDLGDGLVELLLRVDITELISGKQIKKLIAIDSAATILV